MNPGAEQLQEDMRAAVRATVTAKPAAQYIGVSYWKLLELVKAKEIPCIRAGNRLLFRLTTLDSWLEAQEQASMGAKLEPAGKIRRLK